MQIFPNFMVLEIFFVTVLMFASLYVKALLIGLGFHSKDALINGMSFIDATSNASERGSPESDLPLVVGEI